MAEVSGRSGKSSQTLQLVRVPCLPPRVDLTDPEKGMRWRSLHHEGRMYQGTCRRAGSNREDPLCRKHDEREHGQALTYLMLPETLLIMTAEMKLYIMKKLQDKPKRRSPKMTRSPQSPYKPRVYRSPKSAASSTGSILMPWTLLMLQVSIFYLLSLSGI